MASNSHGAYLTTVAEDLAAYDQMPPPLRDVMKQTVVDFAAVPILNMYRRGDLQGFLRAMPATEVRLARKAYGPSHPEAQPRGVSRE